MRRSLDPSLALEAVSQAIVDHIAGLDEATQLIDLYLYQEETATFSLAASSGPSGDLNRSAQVAEILELVDRCCKEARPLAGVQPTAGDPGAAAEARALLTLPVLAPEGAIGVLTLERRGAAGWPEAEVNFHQTLVTKAAILLQASTPEQGSGQAEARLLESLRRELLVDVSHALRSPLTSIKGYSSTLLQSDVTWPPERQQEFLETIDRQIDRLNGIVSALLTPTQPEVGVVQLDRVETTVSELLDKAETELAPLSEERPLRFQCEPGLPSALVDRSRLVQVIKHLAYCAHLVASPGVTVQVRAEWQDDEALVSIGPIQADFPRDDGDQLPDGRSLPPNKGQADVADNGLRLAVCRSLLEAHGVELYEVVAEEQRVKFWFNLPVARPHPWDARNGPPGPGSGG